ncbi:MAG: pentapeptide repeat-containing protein [Deltaproteobacteria bacterium]|nr:pentapeptide repeat-containing protein [Deltaproteobacteria bacterium]
MAAKGITPLTAKQIFDLVSGNTLHMEAIDFNSDMYFQPDGTIAARAEAMTADDTDNGGWDINGENQLCLKFKVWYFGDMRCYSVFPDSGKNGYVLFLNNGALSYNAKSLNGDPAHLYKSPESTKKDTFLRESLTTGQTSPTPVAAAVPHQAPAPANKTAYLRESLAAGQTAASPQEAKTSEAVTQKNEATPATSDAEIEHTVKSLAKNCPGCNLEKSDLRQADLIGANLKGANLHKADLSRANLRRANLEGANLTGATLLSANLPGANLKGANLTDADFTGANLTKADFTGAKTGNMILTNAHLEGVQGLK